MALTSSSATHFISCCGRAPTVIRKHGGLHEFMHWHAAYPDRLGRLPGVLACGNMRKLSEQGVRFQSPVNGDEVFPDAGKVRSRCSTTSMLTLR